MNTGITNVTFQHLGIFQGIPNQRIRSIGSFFQLRYIFDGILELEFLHIRDFIGYQLSQSVGFGQRNFLNTCHILDGRLRSHRTIRNNMCHTFRTIFLRYPAKHFATSVIIKVGINIRQRDTVRIQETLKQQIVFNGVDFGNSQTIGYS